MQPFSLYLFKVNGLFGDRNVQIPFNTNVQILIGENGLGKTTILNILYYTLTGKAYKLREYVFESIELFFREGGSVVIEYEMLSRYEEDPDSEFSLILAKRFLEQIKNEDITEIRNLVSRDISPVALFNHPLFHRSDIRQMASPKRVHTALKYIFGFHGVTEEVQNAFSRIKKEICNLDLIYFPTFRRIEEDLINLGIDDDRIKLAENDTRLIQFGMNDVKLRFERIKQEINSLSSKGLAQISSEILSQLIKGVPEIDHKFLMSLGSKDIEIILARAGNAITNFDKERIINKVNSRNFSDSEDKYLIYFLQKLINIYELQKAIDNDIENFVTACNNYLSSSSKLIVYEASEVEFYLFDKYKNSTVLLSDLLGKLSSGEKQIISLFSKLYLSSNKSFVILFDEPELSLSIFWQQRLLPDILDSKRCSYMLAVTHSPFVYDNELVGSSIGLHEFITRF